MPALSVCCFCCLLFLLPAAPLLATHQGLITAYCPFSLQHASRLSYNRVPDGSEFKALIRRRLTRSGETRERTTSADTWWIQKDRQWQLVWL